MESPHRRPLRSFTTFSRLTAGPPKTPRRYSNDAKSQPTAPKPSPPRRPGPALPRDDIAVREKCLWRLLYETAARAEEVLSSDVDDLDVASKRLRVVRKGGDTDWLHFQSGSARLLPRLTTGRETGPLFLAARRPGPARVPASVDSAPTLAALDSSRSEPSTSSS